MTLLSHGSDFNNRIAIIGKAKNVKAAALIISNNDRKEYELDGIVSWDEKILGKTIKVSGKLFIKTTEAQKPGEPIRQQKLGITRIILHPKWEFIR